jgi:hypothetical protein
MVDDGRIFVGLALLGTLLAGAVAGNMTADRSELRGPVSPEILVERERRLRRLERLIPTIDGVRA